MKKIILLGATLCLFVVVLAGCSNNYPAVDNALIIQRPNTVAPIRIHPNLENSVSMVVDESDYGRVVVTIFNNSEYELTTGHHYRIEFYDGYDWWWIFSDSPFTDEGLVILPNDSITLTKNLYFTVGTLSSGQYRIRKSVFRDIDIPITENDLHDLIAEFHLD